jgi:hypothetical protein
MIELNYSIIYTFWDIIYQQYSVTNFNQIFLYLDVSITSRRPP